jgi:hypothetical protein
MFEDRFLFSSDIVPFYPISLELGHSEDGNLKLPDLLQKDRPNGSAPARRRAEKPTSLTPALNSMPGQ